MNERIQDLPAGVLLNQSSLLEVERYVSPGVYISERYTVQQLETLIETDLGPFVTRSGTFTTNRLMLSNAATGIGISDISYDGSTTYTVGNSKNLALGSGSVLRSHAAGEAQIQFGSGGNEFWMTTDAGAFGESWVFGEPTYFELGFASSVLHFGSTGTSLQDSTFINFNAPYVKIAQNTIRGSNTTDTLVYFGASGNEFNVSTDNAAYGEGFINLNFADAKIGFGSNYISQTVGSTLIHHGTLIELDSAVNVTGSTVFGSTVTLNANASSAMQPVTLQQMNAALVGLWDDRGNFNASVNAYPSSGGSGTAGAILKGDIWSVSVAGTLPTGQLVEVGDTVRALVDTPGNTQANWAIGQNNIGYTPLSNTLNSAEVFVGNASNIATGVALSGDVTITNTGVVTLVPSINKAITGLWSFAYDKLNIYNAAGTFYHGVRSAASSNVTVTFPDKSLTVAGTNDKLSAFAATTSAELAGVISDETGSGSLVFASAPTLTNPVVGTQSANDNSTKAASTAYVDTAAALKANRTELFASIMLMKAGCFIGAAVTAGTYHMQAQQNATVATGTNSTAPPNIINLAADNYPDRVGFTKRLRIKALRGVNATAPGVNFTVGLHPVTAGGGVTGGVTYNAGAVIAGSTVVFTAPGATSLSQTIGTSFAFPATGLYEIAVVNSGTTAVASGINIVAELEVIYE